MDKNIDIKTALSVANQKLIRRDAVFKELETEYLQYKARTDAALLDWVDAYKKVKKELTDAQA